MNLLLSIWISGIPRLFLIAIPLIGFFEKQAMGQDLPQSGEKRNVVLILADDLGFTDLGVHGNPWFETPNLDALYRNSVSFSNAYSAAPVCSPSRASILTGKSPARLKLTNYLIGTRVPDSSSILPGFYLHHLPHEEITLAEVLKSKGYKTGMVGKWHLGYNGMDSVFSPQYHGFDYVLGGRGSANQYFYPAWSKNKPVDNISGIPGQDLTERITDGAVQFLEEKRDSAFFLYVAHYDVHIPLQARDADVEKYRKKIPVHLQSKYNPVYGVMLARLDRSVGRIVEALKRLRLWDNTLLVFTSDNGGLAINEGGAQPTSNTPYREGKGWVYEGGIKVPLFIHVPGVLPRKTTALCVGTDLFTTIQSWIGMNTSVPPGDGKNLVPACLGQKDSSRTLFWHYPHFSNQGGAPAGAVREGKWKLIEWYGKEKSRFELYNLENDFKEEKNCISSEPEVSRYLAGKLEGWRREVQAEMPKTKP